MYGIFAYIYHKFEQNVGKYTIHGASGIYIQIASKTALCSCFQVVDTLQLNAGITWVFCWFPQAPNCCQNCCNSSGGTMSVEGVSWRNKTTSLAILWSWPFWDGENVTLSNGKVTSNYIGGNHGSGIWECKLPTLKEGSIGSPNNVLSVSYKWWFQTFESKIESLFAAIKSEDQKQFDIFDWDWSYWPKETLCDPYEIVENKTGFTVVISPRNISGAPTERTGDFRGRLDLHRCLAGFVIVAIVIVSCGLFHLFMGCKQPILIYIGVKESIY